MLDIVLRKSLVTRRQLYTASEQYSNEKYADMGENTVTLTRKH